MSRTFRIRPSLVASLSVSLLLAACGGATSNAQTKTLAQTDKEAQSSEGSAAKAAPAAAAADAPAAAAGKGDAVAQVDAFIAAHKVDKEKSGWKTSLPKPELATFDASKTYFWNLKTNKGDMRFKLDPKVAPMHVTNCIYLTRLGFYDGTLMHRVVKGFMAQGGCPLGNGRGSPGYKINLELSPSLKHDKLGVLSTANSGPNTDGSQYFIMFAPYPSLDGKYSIYGQIDSGEDTLAKIEAASAAGGRDGPPSEKLTIESATISVE